MTTYYVDTCIWLNLFNKEQAKVQGLPVWKIAELFLKQYKKDIICSEFVTIEIVSKGEKEKLIIIQEYASYIQISTEEERLAREIESQESYNLSFYDCMHLAICKTRGYTLITRDKELLDRGEKYITTLKPENLLY